MLQKIRGFRPPRGIPESGGGVIPVGRWRGGQHEWRSLFRRVFGSGLWGGRGWPFATRGCADFRRQPELRHQAHAALPRDRCGSSGEVRRRQEAHSADHEAKVRELVAARSDITISELASALTALGVKVGRSSVYRFLRRLGLTFKNVWPAPFARGFCRDMRLISLLQRIRPRGAASGHDGVSALRSS